MSTGNDLWSLNAWRVWRDLLWEWWKGIAVAAALGVIGAIGVPDLFIEDPSIVQRALWFVVCWLSLLVVVAGAAFPVALARQRDSAREAIADRDADLARMLERSIDLDVEALSPSRPSDLAGQYLLAVRVTNHGSPGDFFAKVVRPVRGVDDVAYGDFPLRWDLVADFQKRLERGESHRLEIAVTADRNIRFLGPTTSYGQRTIYKQLDIVDPEVQVPIYFCDSSAGLHRMLDLRIEMDHSNTPRLRLEGWS